MKTYRNHVVLMGAGRVLFPPRPCPPFPFQVFPAQISAALAPNFSVIGHSSIYYACCLSFAFLSIHYHIDMIRLFPLLHHSLAPPAYLVSTLLIDLIHLLPLLLFFVAVFRRQIPGCCSAAKPKTKPTTRTSNAGVSGMDSPL